VADLGKANFSAATSNVDEPKGGMLRDAWLRYKPGLVMLDQVHLTERMWFHWAFKDVLF
jgi:hypothetical protein